MSNNIEGKVIVITGAGSGSAKPSARRLSGRALASFAAVASSHAMSFSDWFSLGVHLVDWTARR